MCNLSQGVLERGIRLGEQRGRTEGRLEGRLEGEKWGRERGRAEGEKWGREKTFYGLVRSGLLKVPQAAAQLELSEEEFLRRMNEYKA